jgi:hypothetical protein
MAPFVLDMAPYLASSGPPPHGHRFFDVLMSASARTEAFTVIREGRSITAPDVDAEPPRSSDPGGWDYLLSCFAFKFGDVDSAYTLGATCADHGAGLRLTTARPSRRLSMPESKMANAQLFQGNSRDLPTYACRIYVTARRAGVRP